MFDIRQLPLCLLIGLGGCSEDGGLPNQPSPGPDAGVPTPVTARIEFATNEVELVAGEATTLEVETRSLEGPVRFSIVGDAPGAYLSASEVVPDDEGRAAVRVTAPGESASFMVVASGGGARAELEVTVASGGVTRLNVTPRYEGVRSLSNWRVDVHVATACEAVNNAQPDLSVSADTSVLPLLIEDVPAGKTLSVVVSSGSLARGCTDVPALLAAKTTTVDVLARDFPLKLGLPLAIQFRLEPSAEFSSLLQSRIDALAAAARSATGDDITDLLDAMRQELDRSSRERFDTARTDRDWYSRIGMALTEDGEIRTVSGLVASLLLTGTRHLYEGDLLVGAVSPADELPGPTFLEWQTVGGRSAVSAGFPEQVLATATPEAGDTLRIGATVPWLPDRLLVSLLEEDVELAESTVPKELALRLSCADVAEAVTLAVTVDEVVTQVDAFEGCDRACTRSLCEAAIEQLWNRSVQLLPVASTLHLAAAGVAEVGASTNVLAFSGDWLGTSTVVPEGDIPVRGTFEASTESPDPE